MKKRFLIIIFFSIVFFSLFLIHPPLSMNLILVEILILLISISLILFIYKKQPRTRIFSFADFKVKPDPFQVLISLAGVIISLIIFSIFIKQENQKIEQMMKNDSENQFKLLQQEIDSNLEVLDSVKSFFDASPEVTRQEFHIFTKPLLKKYSNAQALEWIPKIIHEERKHFKILAEIDGIKSFSITEKLNSQMVKARKRKAYYPVYYVEPVETNKAAIGFDLGSNPRSLEALKKAVLSGTKTATSRITLVQETQKQAGILIFNPVYSEASFYNNTPERQKKIRGFTLMVLRVGDMVEKSLGSSIKTIDIKIDDISSKNKPEEIYYHKSKLRDKHDLIFHDTLKIAGKNWEVKIIPHFQPYKKYKSPLPWVVLFSGLSITFLLSAFLIQSNIKKIEIEKLVEEQTEELRESKERYDVAVRGSSVGLWDWNVLTNQLYWSPRFKEIIGITDKDFIPHFREFEDRLHQDDHDFVMDALVEGHINNKKPYDVEYRLKRTDDTYIWVHARGQAIWDENGNPTRMAGSVDDISEKKEAEESLKQSRKRFELVIEGARDGIWDWMDMEKDEEYWSPQWKKLLGYEEDEIKAKASTFFAMIHPDDVEKTNKALEDHLNNKTPFDVEYRLRTKTGEYKWFQAKGLISKDEDTGKKRMTGSITDIDSRKTAEIELEENKIFQELIKESNPDLIFVKDENFKIVDANQVFINLYPENMRNNIIGTTTIETYDEKEAEAFLKMDKKAFKDGFSETIEKINFPDGSLKTLNTKKIRFENPDGKKFILGIGRDVTERENLIDKLSQSNQELERFAYICSHDLQEPLRMIRSFSEKLQSHFGSDLDNDPKGKKYFHFIIDGAKRAQNLIFDILEYSKVAKSVESFEDINIKNIIDLLKTTIEEEKNIITHDSLPIIRGNKTQIYQLFQNIINNALKYQKPNTIASVHISVEDKPQFWQFAIKDNGIGIEKRHQKKIFDIFQRLHGQSLYPGTGIGLSICKKVVEHHGGTIWVDSEKDNGSIFYFTILKTD